MLTQVSLPSGPTLLVDHRPAASSFFCSIWFPYGSRHEASCERGFFHFIEHMLFKGNIRYGAKEIWPLAEGAGGFLNGFTERDTLCIHAHVPEPEWQTALNLLSYMAFASTFPASEFEKERNVVIAEILQSSDEIEERLLDEFFVQFWSGQAGAFPITGNIEDVKALTRDAVIRFYQRFLTPANAIIAVSGPVSAEKITRLMERTLAEIRAAFDPSTAGMKPCESNSAPKPQAGKVYKKIASSQQFHVEAFQLDRPFFGFDYYSLALVSNLIGESSSSRLFRKIREEEGLAYTISSSLYHSRTEAILLIVSAFEPDNAERLLALLDRELENLFSQPLSDQELSDHRKRLAGSFQIMLEDPEFRTRRIARNFIDTGLVLNEKDELERYLSVDRQQVETVLMQLAKGDTLKTSAFQFLFGPLDRYTAQRLGFQTVQSRRKRPCKS